MIDTSTGNALTVTRACLAAIKKHDRNVNAMITVTEENAIRQAEAADEAARNARWLGLLHGMPIAIKDNIATAGVRTTAGSPFFADHMPNENAAVTQRLLNAGAIVAFPVIRRENIFVIKDQVDGLKLVLSEDMEKGIVPALVNDQVVRKYLV